MKKWLGIGKGKQTGSRVVMQQQDLSLMQQQDLSLKRFLFSVSMMTLFMVQQQEPMQMMAPFLIQEIGNQLRLQFQFHTHHHINRSSGLLHLHMTVIFLQMVLHSDTEPSPTCSTQLKRCRILNTVVFA
jgi:hypothetical protein